MVWIPYIPIARNLNNEDSNSLSRPVVTIAVHLNRMFVHFIKHVSVSIISIYLDDTHQTHYQKTQHKTNLFFLFQRKAQ